MTIIYKQLTIQNYLHHEFKVTTNCLNIDLINKRVIIVKKKKEEESILNLSSNLQDNVWCK
jgi:hypothetical protein